MLGYFAVKLFKFVQSTFVLSHYLHFLFSLKVNVLRLIFGGLRATIFASSLGSLLFVQIQNVALTQRWRACLDQRVLFFLGCFYLFQL